MPRSRAWPLRDLVLFFAKRRARRPDHPSLSQIAERYGWTQAEVLAFLRALAVELEVSVGELQQILDR